MEEIQNTLKLFILSGFSFYENSRFTRQQKKGDVISLIPLYHFYLLHRHLVISWGITAESSPLPV